MEGRVFLKMKNYGHDQMSKGEISCIKNFVFL